MRTLFFLLSLLLIATLSHAAVASGKSAPVLGGYSKIKNISDPHIKEIGQYAVTEHNAEAKASLSFVRVVSGESQVVAGVNYKLIVEAKGSADVARYEAVVWEKEWMNFRKLLSFKPV